MASDQLAGVERAACSGSCGPGRSCAWMAVGVVASRSARRSRSGGRGRRAPWPAGGASAAATPAVGHGRPAMLAPPREPRGGTSGWNSLPIAGEGVGHRDDDLAARARSATDCGGLGGAESTAWRSPRGRQLAAPWLSPAPIVELAVRPLLDELVDGLHRPVLRARADARSSKPTGASRAASAEPAGPVPPGGSRCAWRAGSGGRFRLGNSGELLPSRPWGTDVAAGSRAAVGIPGMGDLERLVDDRRPHLGHHLVPPVVVGRRSRTAAARAASSPAREPAQAGCDGRQAWAGAEAQLPLRAIRQHVARRPRVVEPDPGPRWPRPRRPPCQVCTASARAPGGRSGRRAGSEPAGAAVGRRGRRRWPSPSGPAAPGTSVLVLARPPPDGGQLDRPGQPQPVRRRPRRCRSRPTAACRRPPTTGRRRGRSTGAPPAAS